MGIVFACRWIKPKAFGKMCSYVGPFGRPRRRWEDNIKMYLQEVGWGHGLD